MLSLWNLCLSLAFFSPLMLHVTASSGEPVTEHGLAQEPHRYGSALGNPIFRRVEVPGEALSLWSSEDPDRQGVIGEYADLQDSTEVPVLDPSEKIPTGNAALSTQVPQQFTQGPTFRYLPTKTRTGAFLGSAQTQPSHSPVAFPSSGSPPSSSPAGPEPRPEVPSEQDVTELWDWTPSPSVVTQRTTQEGRTLVKEAGAEMVDVTDDVSHRGPASREADKGNSKDVSFKSPKTTPSLEDNMDTTTTTCKTSNQSLTPTYPEDFIPNESLRPALALTSALFVPLYSDWNSALAKWGFAWEAHIYGLGAMFTAFGLISVVSLLGLPLRCPPGSPYLTLLHLFLLCFAGIQAFCLLYDAYNHQERLPPLGSLLLSESSFPCLISAFSLAFLLLSFRSRKHLALPLANSKSCSILPKPCLLFCMILLHVGVSLGCVGILQLFQGLPTVIMLFPQGVFVCLTIFLSFNYLMFFCLIHVDSKHIYRLNDNGESGGSPEVMRPASCPFAQEEDWGRAAGAGVGASLCLLGCGGLQCYGILHGLGLGGVEGYGFQPWPWWGYQVACRICEVGVCLGLSLIGTHPLFCQNNSSLKTITHPRPGSWSRLSCSSPSRPFALPSEEDRITSPVLFPHDSKSQGKQENLVVCDINTKGQSEALPLFSMVDPTGNGLDRVPKSRQIQKPLLPLPTPPSPPRRPKPAAEAQISSLDSLRLETDSTVDLRPPSPINLSRSIDQALFSDSLFSNSIFGMQRLFQTSSSLSLTSPGQQIPKQGPNPVEKVLFRTSSCGDVDQENSSMSRPSQPPGSLSSHSKKPMSPEQWDWKGSVSGSTQGLCNNPKVTGKSRSNSWANRGHNFAQSSLPRGIPNLSYHRRYRTLSLASQDSQGSGRLAGTKPLSESKQLEWDLAVQAEFVTVCRQIDALSVCSDTIEL